MPVTVFVKRLSPPSKASDKRSVSGDTPITGIGLATGFAVSFSTAFAAGWDFAGGAGASFGLASNTAAFAGEPLLAFTKAVSGAPR